METETEKLTMYLLIFRQQKNVVFTGYLFRASNLWEKFNSTMMKMCTGNTAT